MPIPQSVAAGVAAAKAFGAKMAGTKKGKQFVKQPKGIAKKTRAYRKVS